VTEQEQSVVGAVERFNPAFNDHDVDAVMAAMTDDCIFEDTSPPDGQRHEGNEAVRAAWKELFASSPDARFEAEEIFVAGDRCVVLWRYVFVASDPSAGHLRGCDVFRVRDGKVAEKLVYVKG